MAVVPQTKFTLTLSAGSYPGKEYARDAPEIIIGRDSSSDLVISTKSGSRRHARLSREGDQYLIEDLNSSNGTFINDQRLQEKTRLNPGDLVRLGQVFTLEYHAPHPVVKASARQAPAASVKETIVGELSSLHSPTIQPQLIVTISGSPPQVFSLDSEQLTLGRSEENDIVIPSKIVSRFHAELHRENEKYRLIVLPTARNPVLHVGRPLAEPLVLRHSDTLRIGSLDPGSMVTLSYISPGNADDHAAA